VKTFTSHPLKKGELRREKTPPPLPVPSSPQMRGGIKGGVLKKNTTTPPRQTSASPPQLRRGGSGNGEFLAAEVVKLFDFGGGEGAVVDADVVEGTAIK